MLLVNIIDVFSKIPLILGIMIATIIGAIESFSIMHSSYVLTQSFFIRRGKITLLTLVRFNIQMYPIDVLF